MVICDRLDPNMNTKNWNCVNNTFVNLYVTPEKEFALAVKKLLSAFKIIPAENISTAISRSVLQNTDFKTTSTTHFLWLINFYDFLESFDVFAKTFDGHVKQIYQTERPTMIGDQTDVAKYSKEKKKQH